MSKMNPKTEKRQSRHRRVRAKIFGTEERPRLAVYKSNTGIYAQLINDNKNETIAAVSTKGMKLKGNTVVNAKKIGAEIASVAKKNKISKVVFDRGGFLYSGKIKALADEARQNGLEF